MFASNQAIRRKRIFRLPMSSQVESVTSQLYEYFVYQLQDLLYALSILELSVPK